MLCSGVDGVFLKICTVFPSLPTVVLTNLYPGTVPGPFVPFSDLIGFPFSSVQIVILLCSGVDGVFLVYTWTVFPFSSFLVSLKVYSGISFLSVLPFSGDLISLPFSSIYFVTTLW